MRYIRAMIVHRFDQDAGILGEIKPQKLNPWVLYCGLQFRSRCDDNSTPLILRCVPRQILEQSLTSDSIPPSDEGHFSRH